MKQVNKRIYIGLDSIKINIETKQNISVKTKELFSKQTGVNIGKIKQIKNGFQLTCCLPKMVQVNNIYPFGIGECIQLDCVVNELTEIIQEMFSVNLDKAYVCSCEINATAELENKETVECIMNLLGIMFLQGNKKIYFTAKGKKQKRYKKFNADVLQNGLQIESLKTPRLSNKKLAFKVYNKGLEQGIEDKGIIRFEQIHSSYSLDCAKIPRQLNKFLTKESFQSLIELYKKCFDDYFIKIYWKSEKYDFLDTCINTIIQEMQEETPRTVVKIHRALVEIDYELFSRACHKFYLNKKTTQQTIRRIKNSGKLEINEGTINNLVKIFRAILS